MISVERKSDKLNWETWNFTIEATTSSVSIVLSSYYYKQRDTTRKRFKIVKQYRRCDKYSDNPKSISELDVYFPSGVIDEVKNKVIQTIQVIK
jgi:hypothetical protein